MPVLFALVLWLLFWLVVLALGLYVLNRILARVAQRLVPARGQWIDGPHARLHVVDSGAPSPDAPTVILIHGLAGTQNHYHYLMERLAPRYRVIAIDRPGSGYSTRRWPEATQLTEQAEAIIHALERMKVQQPWIVGHSLGGAISLALGLAHAPKLSGLVLLAPLTQMPSQTPQVFERYAVQSPFWRRLMAWTVALPMGLFASGAMIRSAFGPQNPPHDFITRGGGALALCPSHFIGTCEDMGAVIAGMPALSARCEAFNPAASPSQTQGQAHRPDTLPLWMLYGTEDRLLHWQEQGQAFAARVPRLQLQTLAGAGHMLPVTHTEACVQFIDKAIAAERGGV